MSILLEICQVLEMISKCRQSNFSTIGEFNKPKYSFLEVTFLPRLIEISPVVQSKINKRNIYKEDNYNDSQWTNFDIKRRNWAFGSGELKMEHDVTSLHEAEH